MPLFYKHEHFVMKSFFSHIRLPKSLEQKALFKIGFAIRSTDVLSYAFALRLL